jgi:hypothetical protein
VLQAAIARIIRELPTGMRIQFFRLVLIMAVQRGSAGMFPKQVRNRRSKGAFVSQL